MVHLTTCNRRLASASIPQRPWAAPGRAQEIAVPLVLRASLPGQEQAHQRRGVAFHNQAPKKVMVNLNKKEPPT